MTSSPSTPDWHLLDAEETLQRLAVKTDLGLSNETAAARLEQYGDNALRESKSRPLWQLFIGQFADFMIAVLLAAALISGLVGEPVDTLVILLIVILNAVIGTFQEYRAEKAVAALKRLNYIRAKRTDTSLAWINSIFLVMNLLILLQVFIGLSKSHLLPAIARLNALLCRVRTMLLGRLSVRMAGRTTHGQNPVLTF